MHPYTEIESPAHNDRLPLSHHQLLQPVMHALDTFKAGLIEEVNTAQEAHHQQNTALTAQVNSLELRLANAEAERHQLRDEAAKWRAQYEGLKHAM